MAIPILSIRFWLNAFVPRDIAGATTLLNQGEYSGLTALSASPCYLTDQRNFSNELDALSRMHSTAKVEIADSKLALKQQHRCDELIECDRVSGNVIRRARASTSNMNFSLTATDPTTLIRMDCKHTDLIAPTAHGIGEIEYRGIISMDLAVRSVEIDLMICLFPAFEAYAVINDGNPSILFRQAPPAGIMALPLPRGANRRVRSRLEDRDGDGVFEWVAG